jgi:hypothetical protein
VDRFGLCAPRVQLLPCLGLELLWLLLDDLDVFKKVLAVCIPGRIIVHVLSAIFLLSSPFLLAVVHEEPVVRTHCRAWSLLIDSCRGSARGKNIQITRGCPRLDVFALGARSSLVVVARARGVVHQIRDRSVSLLA